MRKEKVLGDVVKSTQPDWPAGRPTISQNALQRGVVLGDCSTKSKVECNPQEIVNRAKGDNKKVW